MRVIRNIIVGLLIVGSLAFVACAPATMTPSLAGPTPAPSSTPAAFTTSNLTLTPDTVKPGEPATVGVTVTNTGGEQGTYTVMVKLHNGTIIGMQDVILAGGTSKNIALSISLASAGTHMIMVDDLDRSLMVQTSAAMTPAPTPTTPMPTPIVPTPTAPTPTPTTPAAPTVPTPKPIPAAFTTSALTITPNTVGLGGNVTVNVMVTNTGEQSGTYMLVMKVNDKIYTTQNITLAGGTSREVTLPISIRTSGNHVVTIDQCTGTLAVRSAAPEMPGMDSCAGM